MNFRLVDSGWLGLLGRALQEENSRVRIICPFIKEQAALQILEHGRPQNLQVITRFDLDAFVEGASDVEALQILQSRGAQIRGIRNLHAKVYLIGSNAIVTSANLTMQALRRNHEFGFESSDPEIFNT
jgi:phosphatidylserine/phosphatidylglycerophosphate/cardiolipin synthase-like enzyme